MDYEPDTAESEDFVAGVGHEHGVLPVVTFCEHAEVAFAHGISVCDDEALGMFGVHFFRFERMEWPVERRSNHRMQRTGLGLSACGALRFVDDFLAHKVLGCLPGRWERSPDRDNSQA